MLLWMLSVVGGEGEGGDACCVCILNRDWWTGMMLRWLRRDDVHTLQVCPTLSLSLRVCCLLFVVVGMVLVSCKSALTLEQSVSFSTLIDAEFV